MIALQTSALYTFESNSEFAHLIKIKVKNALGQLIDEFIADIYYRVPLRLVPQQ